MAGVSALLLRGYAPGLATALALNAPLSLAIFRLAATEKWLPRWSWWWMLPAALLAHGRGLIGLLLLV